MSSDEVSGHSRVRERQQAAVARLGQQALAGASPADLMVQGSNAAALELGADYSKVLELLPDRDRLLMRAGVGWEVDYYGSATIEGGIRSQAGYTLLSSEPVILEDAATETRFTLASLHKGHRITSGVTVVIPGEDRPFGVLGVYTSQRRSFSEDDVSFLQSIANVLAAAIQRKQADEERERLLTEVRLLAEAAQRRAAELSGVLDNMLDAVFVADTDRRVVLVNRAGIRMLGLRESPQVPELLALLRMRRSDGSSFAADHPLVRALAREGVVMENVVIGGLDGGQDLHVRVNAAPIVDGQGHLVGAVAVARDVSAQAELEQLKDQFISMAAHELKTPVAVMKGYSQALLRSGDTVPPAGKKMLQAIDRGSNRIDRIVQDMLDMSRFHFGRLDLAEQPVDLGLLAHQVVDRYVSLAPKHRVKLRAEDQIFVYGDPERLEQVLRNLVDNAVKYSPGGGDVIVRVWSTAEDGLVSVSDKGVGIPADKQQRLFERFYRAHAGTGNDFGGMGVGLYISRQIVERHGGKLWRESGSGVGSTFIFSIPFERQMIARDQS